MADNKLFIVILAIVLLGTLYAVGGWTIPPASNLESRRPGPTAADLTPSSSPSALSTEQMVTQTPLASEVETLSSPSATENRTSLSPSSAAFSEADLTRTFTPLPSSTDRPVMETPSPLPSETKGSVPLTTGDRASPSPSATAFGETSEAPTGEASAEPRGIYLGLGDRLLFQGEGFAFETRLTTSEEFREHYDAAYSSVYIDRVMRENINLSIHSSTWSGRPNPGEVLVRAYTSGILERRDELLWKNRTTGETLTLIFIGARMGIPTGEFEQFHELPEHLRREIGRDFIDEHPESRAARLIRDGYMLTIVTCDSRPGHMEIRRDGSVAFPEQAGFVFVYY